MKNEKSWTRQQYNMIYSDMRRGLNWEILSPLSSISSEIIQAADYSYQAKDYEVHGWTNDIRRVRFYYRSRYKNFNSEVFPF